MKIVYFLSIISSRLFANCLISILFFLYLKIPSQYFLKTVKYTIRLVIHSKPEFQPKNKVAVGGIESDEFKLAA